MSRIEICDVGPRDGLQNEARTLEPAIRAQLCDRLAAAGVPRVEAVSFVHPKRVPQMAGAEEVMAALHRVEGVVYAGLVLNERGYDRAIAAGVDEIHYAFPATDTFCERNQGMTVADALGVGERIVGRAHDDGLPVSVTISVAFGIRWANQRACEGGTIRSASPYHSQVGTVRCVGSTSHAPPQATLSRA